MAESDTPAVELEGLRRDYGDRVALAGVSATLGAGQTLAVLGPNGSGKTTLLRVLAGLLSPSGGEGRVLGCRLPDELWKVRSKLGYLGHQPLLYRDLTGRENLAYVAKLHGIAAPAQRIETILGAVGMERRADDRVAELSSGMARRIDICRVVLGEPELLLLDEPDNSLDVATRELVEPLIGKRSPAARVVVSHERERALDGANQVLELGMTA